MPNPLRTLNEFDRSVWLDFVSGELLRTGALTRMIADDGLHGVNSSSSIFENAIGRHLPAKDHIGGGLDALGLAIEQALA